MSDLSTREWKKRWKAACKRLGRAHAEWERGRVEEKAAWDKVHALTRLLPADISSSAVDGDLEKALRMPRPPSRRKDHG